MCDCVCVCVCVCMCVCVYVYVCMCVYVCFWSYCDALEAWLSHSSQAVAKEGGLVAADVINVPTLSGSVYSCDKLFPPLERSFREVLVEEDVGSCQVLGSLQNSHLVLQLQLSAWVCHLGWLLVFQSCGHDPPWSSSSSVCRFTVIILLTFSSDSVQVSCGDSGMPHGNRTQEGPMATEHISLTDSYSYPSSHMIIFHMFTSVLNSDRFMLDECY